jgi:hypothetical protein
MKGLAAVIGTIQTDSGTVGSDRHLNTASRGRAADSLVRITSSPCQFRRFHRETRLLLNLRSWRPDKCSLLGVRSRNEALKS